jgi:UDP-glucose:(glucosyl)LPS alpha-1,2-glucosyltransferase
LVFVSNWQLSTYNIGLGVPYAESIVLRNAIDPIEVDVNAKTDDIIRIIYHTTPHRGLNIAVAAVKELAKTIPNIHFDVFSSFEAYGWPERDEPYKDLYKEIADHPNMTYHGFQPNDVVREALKHAHIFAYPSIWQETSCIAAIEAMSAGCEVVCSNLAALPETTGAFARMYQFHEDINTHANVFVNNLYHAVQNRLSDEMKNKMIFQKNWTDNFYNWDYRAAEWTQFLQSIKK